MTSAPQGHYSPGKKKVYSDAGKITEEAKMICEDLGIDPADL